MFKEEGVLEIRTFCIAKGWAFDRQHANWAFHAIPCGSIGGSKAGGF
jgi:hypothetical protein